jgi:hypothetical protein
LVVEGVQFENLGFFVKLRRDKRRFVGFIELKHIISMLESFFTLGHIHFNFERHVFIAMLSQDVKVMLHHFKNVREFESQPICCLFDSRVDLA